MKTAFSGSLNGQGNTIIGLYIDRTSSDKVGLFSTNNSGGEIQNIGLENISIRGKSQVGAIAGSNNGTISKVYSTGTVTGTLYWVGGIVGYNNSGSISRSYSTANVSGSTYIGGLVGLLQGAATITNCYATGDIGGSANQGGGLVGLNEGIITNSYSTGTVSGPGGSSSAGGLIGFNDASHGDPATIINSFAAGSVTGNNVGALTGGWAYGPITNFYWADQPGDDVDSCYIINCGIYTCDIFDPECDGSECWAAGCDGINPYNCQGNVPSDEGCQLKATSYFYDPSNAPMNQWNFGSIWVEVSGSYPELILD